jgi:hypothetical protein
MKINEVFCCCCCCSLLFERDVQFDYNFVVGSIKVSEDCSFATCWIFVFSSFQLNLLLVLFIIYAHHGWNTQIEQESTLVADLIFNIIN